MELLKPALTIGLSVALTGICRAQVLCIDCYFQDPPVNTGQPNLILNGGLELGTCGGGFGGNFCPNAGAYSCDFQDWICTGGDVSTYAFACGSGFSTVPQGTVAAYMGNYFCEACSPLVNDTTCVLDSGCVVLGIPPGYPFNNMGQYGGGVGVSLEQTVNGLTIGGAYKFEFWVGGEDFGSFFNEGVFGLTIDPIGQYFLRCHGTSPGEVGRRYVVTFQATNTSHTFKFTNWGHICSTCSEMILDDIQLITTSLSAANAAMTVVPLGPPGCTLSVQGTNQSTGGSGSYLWVMGDGTTYATTDVTHTYAVPGTYTISLLAYPSGCGATDTVSFAVTVGTGDLVDAALVVSEDPVCSGLQVDCQNTSTWAATSYLWDMGDGTTYSTTDVTDHVYPAPGTYTVTLIATDTATCNDADTTTATITLDPYLPVTAGFTATQVFDCAQYPLDLVNTSTGDFLAFLWDMGDGAQYTDTNLTHVYAAPGTYTVTLVVSDALGCGPNDTATVQVTFDPIIPVVAAFSIEQVGNCTLLSVQGLNQSTGDSIAFSWDMGDGATYTTQDVTHTYAAIGTYTVTLTVEDLGCGDDDAFTTTVTVLHSVPLVLTSGGVICPDTTTTLTTDAPPGSVFLWNDGSTAPELVVGQPGQYYVTITHDNCTGSDSIDVIAVPAQELSYAMDACPNQAITLTVPFSATSYLWYNGATGQSITFVFPGTDTTDYLFEAWDADGCHFADTVRVTPLDSEPQLFMPNAFTPDGDGVNDEFVITGFGERDVELLIFDRWGQQIYGTTSLSNPWNGTYNGQIKQDVYVYKLTYNGECSNDETSLIGHITLVK